MRNLVLAFAAFSLIFASACSGGQTAPPRQPGQYSVQKDSVHFDGERYSLYWADSGNALHRMETRNLMMVRDPDRTYLDVPQSGDPVLHLREDEPISIDGRDREGAFSSPWFPFFLGTALGGGFGGGGRDTIIINNPAPGERGSYGSSTPSYRYPPTGTFGRGDELHGTLDSSKPQSPDYARVQPAPYATTAKNGGTGGGTAASNKSVGAGSAVSATSGQSSGTGGGTAASSKGGFSSGSQAYSGGVGAGASGSLTGKSSTGASSSSGAKGISGTRSSGGRR